MGITVPFTVIDIHIPFIFLARLSNFWDRFRIGLASYICEFKCLPGSLMILVLFKINQRATFCRVQGCARFAEISSELRPQIIMHYTTCPLC